MVCYNKNLTEYKDLLKEFKVDLKVDAIISIWQKVNKTDEYPTVKEAKQYLKNKKMGSLVKRSIFAEKVLDNLVANNLVTRVNDLFLVNNVNSVSKASNEIALENLKKAYLFLEVNNIPKSAIKLSKYRGTYKIDLDYTKLSDKNTKASSRGFNKPKTPHLINHLNRLFPDLSIRVVSQAEAKKHYNSLPADQKANVDFNSMRSYYDPVNKQAVLIEGRFSDVVAVEEALHPFVDGLKLDNKALYDNLLNEARKTYPALEQSINENYTDDKGFDSEYRDLEFLTQALSKYFLKKYEEKPTNSFLKGIRKFMKWMISIVKDLHKAITGKNLSIKDLKVNSSLSDIGKLLSSPYIKIDLNIVSGGKVKYSLTPEKLQVLAYLQNKAQTSEQETAIGTLFSQAFLSDDSKTVDTLSAGNSGPLVILNEKNHTYYDLNNKGEQYKSTTERFKGKMGAEDLKNKAFNLDIGNDFDSILEGLASNKSADELKSKMTILKGHDFDIAYTTINENLKAMQADGSIAIPQVIVYDKVTKTAGAIDLLLVKPDGTMKIVDLKVSKNSVESDFYSKKPLELSATSELRRMNVDKLTIKGQQGLQVNMYRRMLHNMGYPVDMSESGAVTFHIKVGVEGTGVNQKFTGTIATEGFIQHSPQDQQIYVDYLLPKANTKTRLTDPMEDVEVDEETLLNPEGKIESDVDDFLDSESQLDVIQSALIVYKKALISKRDAIENIKSKVFMDRTKEQTLENIQNSIIAINLSLLEEGSERLKLYTQFLRDALSEIKAFGDYMANPLNFNKPEYIAYANNYNRFIKTFEGLHSVKSSDIINQTQVALIGQIQIQLNETSELVNEGIENHVKAVTKETSSRDDLTDDVLNDLVNHAKDIPFWELQFNDMATSEDTLLAVMDKIYKAKKQEMFDKILTRNNKIKAAAAKLQKLAPGVDPQRLFDFMLQINEEGEFNGRYIKKLGKAYFSVLYELREALYDEVGNRLTYKNIFDVSEASEEDIQFNIDLAEAKRKHSAFWRAEQVGINNTVIAGRYHRYTDEFIKERAKFEDYQIVGDSIFWTKRTDVSKRAYDNFRYKYYDEVEYTRAVRIGGNYTGQIEKGSIFYAVKQKYRVANERINNSPNGNLLTSEKYNKIMNPTNALEQAQKEFYEMFVDVYENDLLEKLSQGHKANMVGKVPIIKSKMFDAVKDKPNIVAKLWAKATRSIENLSGNDVNNKAIVTDEEGNLIDTLPVYFVGKTRYDAQLKKVNEEIEALQAEYKRTKKNFPSYKKKLNALRSKRKSLENMPAASELNRDMGSALLKFSGMAEHYEVMSGVEDTFNAFIKVIENREYQPGNWRDKLGSYANGKFVPKGTKSGAEKNTVRRAKRWMNMVFYDNDQTTRGMFEKLSDGLINYSSLSYVAFNPFGNFNNYVLGRINNSIEAIGQRFYSFDSYKRAELEFNKKAIPDAFKRLGSVNLKGKSNYDPNLPINKYEAFVDFFRMMDDKSDLRELEKQSDVIEKSYYAKAIEFGYVMQDAAEYNVQTKVGMAMVMDTMVKNKDTNEIISLYDAFQFDPSNGKLTLKEGFDTVVYLKGGSTPQEPVIIAEESYNDQFRYKLRNKIREVNKEIHGNYAADDRMIIQAHALGRLAAQFHKWVAPAMKARFRREYFDENLGWMEGRYRSFWKFLAFSVRKMAKVQMDFSNYQSEFLDELREFHIENSKDNSEKSTLQIEQRLKNKLKGAHRTMAEIGIIMLTLALNEILAGMFRGDDDDNDTVKRLKNVMRYQVDRTYKELILFIPLLGSQQQMQIMKSPIASTRTLGELGEALWLSVATPLVYAVQDEETFSANS
ncbi:MAG: hypothetical protein HRT87_01755, partial [Legionellales bacterium]|nr:hypothetical protein [Legionellales bacterium]